MSTETVLHAILQRLESLRDHNPAVEESPRLILWPDKARLWEEVIDRFGQYRVVLTHGPFENGASVGPAYWIRGAVAEEAEAGVIPIVYLPGWAREDLRAIDDCPPEIAPIAPLQFRGRWFTHRNGKDWTPTGLLLNQEDGLGLNVAESKATAEALQAALDQLLSQPVARLRERRIDASFVNELISPNPTRALLEFINDPVGFKAEHPDIWPALRSQWKDKFDFDPDTDGELAGARRLGERGGSWAEVWDLFVDRPELYSGTPEQLRRARPEQLIVDQPESWPQENEGLEIELMRELGELDQLGPGAARDKVQDLEVRHGVRRGWVWADLGRSPLAFAVEHIAMVARTTSVNIVAGSISDLVDEYTDWGWKADEAALEALRLATEGAPRDAVVAALRVVYRDWIGTQSDLMQELVSASPDSYQATGAPDIDEGSLVVFIDGLRYDLGLRLARRLGDGGLDVIIEPVLAALPTVTHTSKPNLIPVPDGELGPGPGLSAGRAENQVEATVTVLRSILQTHGVQVVTGIEAGDPDGRGWHETGNLDEIGHNRGIGLVDELQVEIDRVVRRVRELIDAGWATVHIVTDHGFVLVPGGMGKRDLPVAVVVDGAKKGRAARLQDGAQVPDGLRTVPWHWDSSVRIAVAPGVYCFEAGKTYEHGGISPQECIVPRLTVTRGSAAQVTHAPEIVSLEWRGVVCRVEYSGIGPGGVIDVRRAAADESSSLAIKKADAAGEGHGSVYVDDAHEGESAVLVIVAADGRIVAQRSVTIGANT